MKKDLYQEIADRFNQIGYTKEMADKKPEQFNAFLRGEKVMLVREEEGKRTVMMLDKGRLKTVYDRS